MKRTSTNRLDLLLLFAGVLVIALAFILSTLAQSSDTSWLEFFREDIVMWAVIAAVGFALLNFFGWNVVVECVIKPLPQTSSKWQRRRQRFVGVLVLVLKLIFVMSVLLFFAQSSKKEVVSFLLGFTAFLFVGMVLALLFQRYRCENRCDHSE